MVALVGMVCPDSLVNLVQLQLQQTVYLLAVLIRISGSNEELGQSVDTHHTYRD